MFPHIRCSRYFDLLLICVQPIQICMASSTRTSVTTYPSHSVSYSCRTAPKYTLICIFFWFIKINPIHEGDPVRVYAASAPMKDDALMTFPIQSKSTIRSSYTVRCLARRREFQANAHRLETQKNAMPEDIATSRILIMHSQGSHLSPRRLQDL